MAKIRVILYKNARITADGCGYNMAGEFFSDWKDAIQQIQDEEGEEPLTREQLAEIEENHHSTQVQERETRSEARGRY